MESNKGTINTKKLFIFNLHYFINYLFSWQVMPFLAVFSLFYLLYPLSPLLYLFGNVAIMMMVYKLAFDILAYVAAGDMSPHEVRQNYLVTNAIAVKVFMIALLVEGTLRYMEYKGVNAAYRYYVLSATAFVTPAVYMSLALTNSLLFALNPINIFRVIKTTHISYLLFVGFWLFTIFLHEIIINPFVFKYFPVFIDGIVSSFIEFSFMILNFHIMGYIVFQKRHQFDLAGIGIKHTDDDYINIEKKPENPAYETIRNLLDNDDEKRALAIIIQQQKEGDRGATLQGLYKRAMQQKLYSPTNKEVAFKIHHLLELNETRKAFNMLRDHLDSGQSYIEHKPDDVRELVSYAVNNNKNKYIPILLKEFHKKYPYHADIVPNYFTLAQVLYNDSKTKDQAIALLEEILRDFPNDPSISEVRGWYRGVELLRNRRLESHETL